MNKLLNSLIILIIFLYGCSSTGDLKKGDCLYIRTKAYKIVRVINYGMILQDNRGVLYYSLYQKIKPVQIDCEFFELTK